MFKKKGRFTLGRERQMQKNAETRKAILDAATAIGLEEGFDELSIRKITDRLGYSSGIVYHYFKDKQEILDTVHHNASMGIKDAIEICINPDRSFVENIRVVFKILTEISVYEPDAFKLIILNKYSHKAESIDEWLNMIRECLEMGIANGELRDININITAYTLLNTFLVAQMIIDEQKNSDKNMVENIFETELDIILNGIINKKEDKDIQ